MALTELKQRASGALTSQPPSSAARHATEQELTNTLLAAGTGLKFTAYPRAIFVGLVAAHLQQSGRTVASLTLGELRDFSYQAAKIHADKLAPQIDAATAQTSSPRQRPSARNRM